jgi:Protein of unknown function (DUF1553)
MRDNCEVRRTRSNTPLQALAMLNDQQVLEAARALSKRVLEDTKLTDAKTRLYAAFTGILTRPPTSAELKPLTAYFESELARLTSDPKAADKLLKAHSSGQNVSEQAALMLAITVIYNMDEAIVM